MVKKSQLLKIKCSYPSKISSEESFNCIHKKQVEIHIFLEATCMMELSKKIKIIHILMYI